MNASKVAEAVHFLQHPDVRPMSDEAKREFLRTKGLAPEEIEQAYVEVQNREFAQQSGFWSLRNVVAVGTGAYIAYRAVTGLLGWLTAEESERQQRADAEAASAAARRTDTDERRRLQKAEEAMEEMRARLAAQEAELQALRSEVASMLSLKTNLNDTKTQLESLKKSMLSKNSFPSPSYLRPPAESGSAAGSASLPAWQLNQRGAQPDVEKPAAATDASENCLPAAPGPDASPSTAATNGSGAENGNTARNGTENGNGAQVSNEDVD